MSRGLPARSHHVRQVLANLVLGALEILGQLSLALLVVRAGVDLLGAAISARGSSMEKAVRTSRAITICMRRGAATFTETTLRFVCPRDSQLSSQKAFAIVPTTIKPYSYLPNFRRAPNKPVRKLASRARQRRRQLNPDRLRVRTKQRVRESGIDPPTKKRIGRCPHNSARDWE